MQIEKLVLHVSDAASPIGASFQKTTSYLLIRQERRENICYGY